MDAFCLADHLEMLRQTDSNGTISLDCVHSYSLRLYAYRVTGQAKYVVLSHLETLLILLASSFFCLEQCAPEVSFPPTLPSAYTMLFPVT